MPCAHMRVESFILPLYNVVNIYESITTVHRDKHAEHRGVSNHQQFNCLFKRLLYADIKYTNKAPHKRPFAKEIH